MINSQVKVVVKYDQTHVWGHALGLYIYIYIYIYASIYIYIYIYIYEQAPLLLGLGTPAGTVGLRARRNLARSQSSREEAPCQDPSRRSSAGVLVFLAILTPNEQDLAHPGSHSKFLKCQSGRFGQSLGF